MTDLIDYEGAPVPVPEAVATDELPEPPGLRAVLVVDVTRSATRRICERCRRRRILYWLDAVPLARLTKRLCSECSGLLVHGGKRA